MKVLTRRANLVRRSVGKSSSSRLDAKSPSLPKGPRGPGGSTSPGHDIPIRSGHPDSKREKPNKASSFAKSSSSSKSPSKSSSKPLRGRSFEDLFESEWLKARALDDYLDVLESTDLEKFDDLEADDFAYGFDFDFDFRRSLK